MEARSKTEEYRSHRSSRLNEGQLSRMSFPLPLRALTPLSFTCVNFGIREIHRDSATLLTIQNVNVSLTFEWVVVVGYLFR